MVTSTAAALVLLSTGCREPADHRVGVVLGDEGVRGATLAVEDLRAAGGPAIRLLALTGMFGTSASVALQGAESLAVDTRVLAVVGHTNSSSSLSASQVYNARRVVQIAPTSTSPLYSQAGPYSFRLVGSDFHQARFLAQQLSAAESKRVAIVYTNDDYGRSLRRLMVEELARRGVVAVYEGVYAESESDGQDLVRALAHARPTVLVWLGRDPFYSRIRDGLRAVLPALPVLASDGFGGVSGGPDASRLDEVRYIRLVNVDTASVAMKALQARYSAGGGVGPLTDQVVLSYDAVMLLGTAIREAGADREAIRAWLNRLGRSRPAFVGMTGPIAFSDDGDRESSYVLVAAGAGDRRRPAR